MISTINQAITDGKQYVAKQHNKNNKMCKTNITLLNLFY